MVARNNNNNMYRAVCLLCFLVAEIMHCLLAAGIWEKGGRGTHYPYRVKGRIFVGWGALAEIT